jgi:hypothetical protein
MKKSSILERHGLQISIPMRRRLRLERIAEVRVEFPYLFPHPSDVEKQVIDHYIKKEGGHAT